MASRNSSDLASRQLGACAPRNSDVLHPEGLNLTLFEAVRERFVMEVDDESNPQGPHEESNWQGGKAKGSATLPVLALPALSSPIAPNVLSGFPSTGSYNPEKTSTGPSVFP
jgi:hypothetical protein